MTELTDTTELAPQLTFAGLGVRDEIVRALAEKGIEAPFAIQELTLPLALAGLTACGVEVVGREAHAFAPNEVNDAYLATKAVRFGHLLD